MPRLVDDQRANAGRGELNSATEPSTQMKIEDYLERVAKYVPIEIIAAFIAVRGFMPPTGSPNAPPPWAEFVLFAALVGLTWGYLYKFGGRVPRKELQASLGAFSFMVWAYGIGGPFFFKALEESLDTRIEYQGLAAAVVVVWSLLAGLIQPKS